ncbi:MAG: alpha/beta hydrolase [Acidimicrobiales bacterium]
MSDPAASPPNIPHLEQVVELADGRLLGYAEFGDPGGRPVLWFHGTPGASKQVPPEAPAVACERGVRLIGIERPGTGRSTPHQYARILDWAVDVRQVADRLGLDRFALVGLSGGGPYVLACAYLLPDRVVAGAVLGGIGPTVGPEAAPGYTRLLAPFGPLLSAVAGPAGLALSCLLRPLAATVASPAFDLYARFGPSPDRPVLARADMKAAFLHDLTTAIPRGLRAPVYDLVLFARHWGFSLRDIRVPIRFWHGADDIIVPLSHGVHQAELVPDAELTVVPGGGHFSGYETVHEVLDTLLELWSREARHATPV